MSDITQKKEADNNASSSSNSTDAALPKTKKGRGDLLSQVAKEASQKNLQPQGPSAKEKLIESYLKGEISLGEMTYKLKVFNSVVADTVLRDAKDSGASQINSEDASKHGSGISKAGLAKALEEGKEEKSHKDSEDEAKERQIQKKEEKKEAQEKEQIIVRANLFDQESKDLKKAQRWREIQKLEKEETEEYQDKKLEDELLSASEERKNALAKDREMKIKATSTKHGVSESTSSGGEKAGR